MAKIRKQLSLKKIASYAIITIFVLIIIVAFTVPQYMNNAGANKNILAVVNGEEVYRIDLNRFANQMLQQYGMNVSQLDERMMGQIEQMYISSILQNQLAESQGITVSDERVKNKIKSIFVDKDGNYSKEILEMQLERLNMSYQQLFSDVKNSIAANEFNRLLYYGNSASPDEVKYSGIVSNSVFQLKYLYISNNKVRDMFKNEITVTEAEINAEMAANPDEIKDPKSDKARIRQKLFNQKLIEKKNDFVAKLNKYTETMTLEEIAEKFQLEVKYTKDFKIGQPVMQDPDAGKTEKELEKEKKEKKPAPAVRPQSLEEMTATNAFYTSFLNLKIGDSSKVIETQSGLFIYSPEKQEISEGENDDQSRERTESSIAGEKVQDTKNKIYRKFMEESTISRGK